MDSWDGFFLFFPGYGSGAPRRKFFEDIAATPASSSPSKWVEADPGTQSSSSSGSANQKTMWFRSVRTPVNIVKCESLIDDGIHADRTSARRIRGEVPDILNRAEGGTGISVRKTAKVVLGRRPSACKSSVSTPRVFPRKNGNGRRRVLELSGSLPIASSWYQVEPGRP